jgi:hypothetical protein
MTAEVLSYSRSKGVFGGLELKGTAITADKKDIENVYGSGVNAEKVLRMPEDSAPKEVQPFPETLFSFTPKGAEIALCSSSIDATSFVTSGIKPGSWFLAYWNLSRLFRNRLAYRVSDPALRSDAENLAVLTPGTANCQASRRVTRRVAWIATRRFNAGRRSSPCLSFLPPCIIVT